MSVLSRCRAVALAGRMAAGSTGVAVARARAPDGPSRGEWIARERAVAPGGDAPGLRAALQALGAGAAVRGGNPSPSSQAAACEAVARSAALRPLVALPTSLLPLRAAAGERGLASKARAKKKGAAPPPIEGLEKGVEREIFTCPKPNRFRLLGGGAAAYAGFSLWAGANQYLYPPEGVPTIYGYVIYLGLFMSGVMLYVVHNHARRHVARLALIPGLVDQIIVTTHTILGGEVTKTVLLHQIVPDKEAEAREELTTPWKRFRIQGDSYFYLLDDSGVVHDEELARLIVHGKPIPKSFK